MHKPAAPRSAKPATHRSTRPIGLSVVLAALVAGGSLTSVSATPAGAQVLGQEADPAAGVAAGADAGGETGTGNRESEIAPPVREQAPDTNSCPHSLTPPTAQTTSERPRPGQPMPTPPPAAPQQPGECGITAAPGYQVPEEQTASAWMVFDLDSADIIAQKDPHGRYRPASIIKVLLALVAIDQLDLDKEIPVSEKAAEMEGSAVGIGVTGHYTARQLLYGLLLASGNDAAQALAEALGGEKETTRKVNELAHQLGATDTFVGNFAGLDTAGQMTSAHDLALFYRAAWKNPTFAEIVGTKFIDFPGHHDNDPGAAEAEQVAEAPATPGAGAGPEAGANPGSEAEAAAGDQPKGNGFELWNDNKLLLEDPEGIGGKTGYTDDAHHTFVGAVNHEGRRICVIILDTTVDKGRAWEQAQRFAHAAYEVPAGQRVEALGQGESAGETADKGDDAGEAAGDQSPSEGGRQGDPAGAIVLTAGGLGLFALVALVVVLVRRRGARG